MVVCYFLPLFRPQIAQNRGLDGDGGDFCPVAAGQTNCYSKNCHYAVKCSLTTWLMNLFLSITCKI